jgi:hypothetical protein
MVAPSYFAYSFPSEVPLHYSRLSMKEYSRPSPFTQPNTTTIGSIRLPMPTQLIDDYGMHINSENFDLLGNYNNIPQSLAAGRSAYESIKGEYESGGFTNKLIEKIVLSAAATTPGLSDTGAGRFAQSQVGVVRNPHLTTIFQGVSLKSYSFSWRLSPTSDAEAREINSMLNIIKGYMHPKLSNGGFTLDYPYIANLEFEVGDVAYSQLPKVRDSFITKMDVNTSGGGSIAFYRDGNPVNIDISLGFQEIDILTREDFIKLSQRGD